MIDFKKLQIKEQHKPKDRCEVCIHVRQDEQGYYCPKVYARFYAHRVEQGIYYNCSYYTKKEV